MTAIAFMQLVLLGVGAVIGLFIGVKAAHFIFRQLLKMFFNLSRLLFREVPQLIIQVIAAILGSLIMAVIGKVAGVPVEVIMERIADWIASQGGTGFAFFTQLTAQISTLIPS